MDLHKLTIGSSIDLDGHPLNVTDDPVTLELVDKGIMIARLGILIDSSTLDVDDAAVEEGKTVTLMYFRRRA